MLQLRDIPRDEPSMRESTWSVDITGSCRRHAISAPDRISGRLGSMGAIGADVDAAWSEGGAEARVDRSGGWCGAWTSGLKGFWTGARGSSGASVAAEASLLLSERDRSTSDKAPIESSKPACGKPASLKPACGPATCEAAASTCSCARKKVMVAVCSNRSIE